MILHRKHAWLQKLISKRLVTNMLHQVYDVVWSKWRWKVPITLVLPRDDKVSTWDESKDKLVRYNFLQTDDGPQLAINRIDEKDCFSIWEFAVESLPPNKAANHDGLSLEIIQKIFHFHLRWLLALYNHFLRMSFFRHGSFWLQCTFPKRARTSVIGLLPPIYLLPPSGRF